MTVPCMRPDSQRREFAPEISLGTSLSMAGSDLLELAGALTERGEPTEWHLERAEMAARKVLNAIGDYHKFKDAARLAKARPATPPGLRAEDVLPDRASDAAYNLALGAIDDDGEAA